jgi:hypothetical protein
MVRNHLVDKQRNVALGSMCGHSSKHVTVHGFEASSKSAECRILNFVNVTDESVGTFGIGKLPRLETVGTTLNVIFNRRREVNQMWGVVPLVDDITTAQKFDATAHQ